MLCLIGPASVLAIPPAQKHSTCTADLVATANLTLSAIIGGLGRRESHLQWAVLQSSPLLQYSFSGNINPTIVAQAGYRHLCIVPIVDMHNIHSGQRIGNFQGTELGRPVDRHNFGKHVGESPSQIINNHSTVAGPVSPYVSQVNTELIFHFLHQLLDEQPIVCAGGPRARGAHAKRVASIITGRDCTWVTGRVSKMPVFSSPASLSGFDPSVF
jgi:hypothetical protein